MMSDRSHVTGNEGPGSGSGDREGDVGRRGGWEVGERERGGTGGEGEGDTRDDDPGFDRNNRAMKVKSHVMIM